MTPEILRESCNSAMAGYFAKRMSGLPQSQAWNLATFEDCRVDTQESWFAVHENTAWIGESIGCFGQTAESLLSTIGDATGISLYINSRGGDSACALKVYRGLVGRVTLAQIQGNCFSAAMTLAMSASRIKIESSAKMMLHRPCNFVYGTSEALRKDADSLDHITGEIIGLVVKRTGLPASTVEGWFAGADTYFNAEQAVKHKLADEIFFAPLSVAPSHGADTPPGKTDEERQFWRFLRRFDTLPVGDKQKFFGELDRWLFYRVK
jgi:ATP-dependent protease ClpP protease subunit